MDKKPKILIVEDERIIAKGIRHSLESMGYNVPAIVSSVEEAIKKTEELHPDLVLMDIIPQEEMDGVEAAGQTRTRFDIPVVYITANVSDARLEDIKRTEPFGCLFKPFENVELHAAIEMALHKHKMEKKLQESEEKFRTIFESSEEGYYEIDLAGRFTFFNETMRKISGHSAEELMGMSNLEYTTPETAKKMYKLFNEIYKTGNPGEIGEYEGTAKDGTKITLGLSAYLMRDEKGEPVGFRGIVRDITAHRRMEEELEQSFESLRRGLNATINVLVAAVEMRDPYTAGHQKHVANLARAIATEMGIQKEKIEGIRMAGAIHDIGKISVPPEILSKPGPLQDIEFAMIKLHPQVGYDILKNIEFPWPVALIVLQHHERMDGSGYPQGLSGEEICLEARIMAVADVIDAMSSHRPYRPALDIEKALEEILQNRGTLYDPEAVDACVRLFTEKGFKLR